jgi:hypothetical protein
MSPYHIFLRDSAGDKSNCYLQLHQKNKRESKMRCGAVAICIDKHFAYRDQSQLLPAKCFVKTRDGVRASGALAAILRCIHLMCMPTLTAGNKNISNL